MNNKVIVVGSYISGAFDFPQGSRKYVPQSAKHVVVVVVVVGASCLLLAVAAFCRLPVACCLEMNFDFEFI
jgi:hypothetical protein